MVEFFIEKVLVWRLRLFFWLSKQVWQEQKLASGILPFFLLFCFGNHVAVPYLSLWNSWTFSNEAFFAPVLAWCNLYRPAGRHIRWYKMWICLLTFSQRMWTVLGISLEVQPGPWSAHSTSLWKRASTDCLQPQRNGLIKMHKGMCTVMTWMKKAVFTYCYTKNIHTSSNCQSCLQATMGIFPL